MPSGNYDADHYKPSKENRLPDLRLGQEDADRLFDQSIRAHAEDLRKNFPDLDRYPPEAQKAMLDMMYNMGANKFNPSKWNGLYNAIQKQDWDKAAIESHRRGVQDQRNDKVKNLFLTIRQRQNASRSQ